MKAFITGITGQDGFFLAKLLLDKGYEVHGLVRRNSQLSFGSLDGEEIKENITFHWGDVTDHTVLDKIIREHQFEEIYHLAAQSFVGLSFQNPTSTYDINISGTLNVVNAVKEYSPKSKLYFAATSELYGQVKESPQTENTQFHPRSPYAVSKLAGFWTIKNYRESYDLFMSNGILFNHESEKRGPEFVTRKITLAVAKISMGMQDVLEIGNLDAKRDWGHAEDYVRGMWLMLQHDTPDDFVLATGENHSVREFVTKAFLAADILVEWRGSGLEEVGVNKNTEEVVVRINKKFYRPAEVDVLVGDSKKAKTALGWKAEISFDDLVHRMVNHDISTIKKE